MLSEMMEEQQEGIQRWYIEIGCHVMAIMQLLFEKGVCTQKEFDVIAARYRAHLDQELSRKKDEELQKIANDPGLSLLAKLFGVELPSKFKEGDEP
jgi:hypothetical protein